MVEKSKRGWAHEYLSESFQRSLVRWNQDQSMTMLVSIVIAAALALLFGGFLVLAQLLAGWKMIPVFLVGWFLMLWLIVTPARMWKEQRDKLNDLTIPKLAISKGDAPIDKEREWIALDVHNTSSVPINGCYGQLVRFRSLRPVDGVQLPPQGFRFAWTPWANHGGPLATIGSDEHGFLGIAVGSLANPPH